MGCCASGASKGAEEESVPRFSANSTEGLVAGCKYLAEHGFVVWSTNLSGQKIAHLKTLFYDWAKEAVPDFSSEMKIHPEKWPSYHGILESRGIGQSKFLWACRTLPEFRHIYSTLYNTNDLFVSFDGCNASLGNEGSAPWPHIDQSLTILPPTSVSVQSLLNLIDVTPTKGGSLVVYRGSHKMIAKRWLEGDHTLIHDSKKHGTSLKDDKELDLKTRTFISLKEGEIASWLSTTVHENQLCELFYPRLQRLAAYVSMSPLLMHKHDLQPFSLNQLSLERYKAASQGMTTSHWATLLPQPKPRDQDSPVPASCLKTAFSDDELRLLVGKYLLD